MLLLTLDEELPAQTEKVRNWYIKTQELRWTQAEVLQVMEEIERMGTGAMVAFLAARHHLERLYGQLLDELAGQLSDGAGAAADQ